MEFLLQQGDKLFAICLLIAMSISLRFLLQITGQRWITTTAHTATLVVLPIITFVITQVISGNIALSLGMVGALSIVRFRNPVRSPLELSVYFGAITMGITASVSLSWLVFLGISLAIAIFTLIIIHYIFEIFFNQPFFNASFSEGNSLSTLEVSASANIPDFDNSDLLTFKTSSDQKFEYILTSKSFADLAKILNGFEQDQRILSYKLNK